MFNFTKLTVACGLLALMAGGCFAEEIKYFHLDFVVKELDGGKAVNTRHYWTTVSTGEHGGCSIRSGSRVPVPTGSTGSSYTFADVGVNIDCNSAQEVDGSLSLTIMTEVSSLAPPENPPAPQPVIRQNKWNARVIIPVGKPTMIFSSDDPASKAQMQLEVTATSVK